MKTVTYGEKKIEYDEMHACIICGEPVHNASMGGTVICPACDLGKCRFCRITVFVLKKEIDGGRSYNEIREHMKWHRELLGLPEKYTEKELFQALLKFKEGKPSVM